jgi:hypothetical protein
VTVRTAIRHAAALAAISALSILPVHAEGPPKPPAEGKAAAETRPAHETQQERMKRCSASAKDKALKGDERRAYMSACLKG